MRYRLWMWLAVVILLLVVPLPGGEYAIQGQSNIEILNDEVDIRYPYLVNFLLDAESDGAEITEVRLLWQAGSGATFNVTRMNFTPSELVTIQFPLNVQFLRLPPFAQISYRWELRDDNGNQFTTDNKTFEYEDSRNEWQTLENDRLRLLWYDLEPEFAAELFALSDEALMRLAVDFGVMLDEPPVVVVYPEQEAFAEFQAMMANVEFVIGRYFPGHNITVNLVTPDMPQSLYADTLAHELSHLYSDNFYVGFARLPLWLEEGLATFNEGADLDEERHVVQMAAAAGDLVPFIDLPMAIRDRSIQVTNLAYAEGATVFEFIRDTWGQDSIAEFLTSFRQTTSVDDVTRDIYGLSMAEFELAWRAWLGYPVESVPELVATPTLRPFTFPTPTYGVPGS